jgi:hypothetical protein
VADDETPDPTWARLLEIGSMPPALVREAFVWLVGREPKSGLPK